MHQPGRLIVISGPSGTGKTSICNELLKRLPRARWSTSCTTRPMRPGDVDGQTYHFVSCDEFMQMKQRGEFLETAEYLGHFYGTPAEPVRQAVRDGVYIILEIEVQGGAQVARQMPESIRIFVLPPTMETLKARLAGRKTESEQQQAKRLAEADGEIGFARDSGCYQYFVTNDELDITVEEILQLIASAK
ncbi:MAG: Guanylate kinase [Phycisphaerae bacterium]|nr:Guanylate kinase [Phycisphaerae bacterium]